MEFLFILKRSKVFKFCIQPTIKSMEVPTTLKIEKKFNITTTSNSICIMFTYLASRCIFKKIIQMHILNKWFFNTIVINSKDVFISIIKSNIVNFNIPKFIYGYCHFFDKVKIACTNYLALILTQIKVKHIFLCWLYHASTHSSMERISFLEDYYIP